MFATLFAQEFRENGKKIAAVLGVGLLVVAVSAGGVLLKIPLVSGVLKATLVIASIAVPFVIVVQLASAYWTSMYGSRGYFTHTIPARGRDLYWAKTLFAMLFGLIGQLFAVFGLLVSHILMSREAGMGLAESLRALIEIAGTVPTIVIVIFVAGLLLSLAQWVFGGAAVMSIGAEGRWNRQGFTVPAIGLVLLYLAGQALSFLGMLLPGSIDPETLSFSWSSMLADLYNGAENPHIGLGMIPMTFLLTIVLALFGIRSIERRTSLR